MKTFFTAVFAIALLLIEVPCYSGYVLHLRDGNVISVNSYWEEGDEIRFSKYGGVTGIRKDLLVKIEVVESAHQNEKAEEHHDNLEEEIADVLEVHESADQPSASEEERKDHRQDDSVVDQKALFIEEKSRLENEMQMAVFYFNAAKERNDNEEKDRQWNNLKVLQEQLSDLEERVSDAHGGTLPEWWENHGEDF